MSTLSYSVRSLVRRPALAFTAIVTVAVAVGANSAVFSLVNSVLLRPLPFRAPDRLVQVWQTHPTLGNVQAAYPDFVEWRAHAKSFDAIAAYTFQAVNKVTLLGEGEPELLQATMSSHELFPMMGIPILIGRGFSGREEAEKKDVVLLSERLWRRKFNADPGTVRRTIRVGPLGLTVVGVVRQQGAFPVWADLWLPLSRLEPMVQQSRRFRPLEVVARLGDGITVPQAQAEMTALSSSLARQHTDTNGTLGAWVVPLLTQVTKPIRAPLLIIWTVVGLLLLIASVNVAHLLLTRTISRQRELAIRVSLGARSGDLAQLLACEGVLLVGAGGLLGWLLARLLLQVLKSFPMPQVPRIETVSLDATALAYTVLAVLIAAAIATVPAYLQIRNANLSRMTKESDVYSFSGRGTRPGFVLMASELALAFAMFAGTLLLTRSFAVLSAVEPGFDTGNVLAIDILLPRGEGWDQAARTFETRLAPAILALPSVEGVAAANMAPMSLDRTETSRYTTRFNVKEAAAKPDVYPVAQLRWISEDYFRVLGIPLRRGRLFSAADKETPRRIINETLARQFFPGQDPIGRELLLGVDTQKPETVEIVGVVADMRDLGVDLEPQPMIYTLAVSPVVAILVRTSGDPMRLPPLISGILRDAAPDAPVTRIRTLDQLVGSSLARQRFALWLTSAFAGMAAILTIVGVYGVLAYGVSRRQREFGIRAALGASRRQVIRLVVLQALRTTAVGLVGGAAIFWSGSRLLESMLFQVSPGDPVSWAAAIIVLTLVSLLAALLPAIRAAYVDPSSSLRSE